MLRLSHPIKEKLEELGLKDNS